MLQRRDGRAALLPALEQLPVEHDVRVPPTPADRGVRRRHAGLQRGVLKGAQGIHAFIAAFFMNIETAKLYTYILALLNIFL